MKPVLIGIFGPTASGKSRLALELAEKLEAEIINCDSLQVYKKMDIGTAKPTKEELKRVPHHLIDHIDVGETYAAGQYRRDVLKVLNERFQRGQKLFFLVGGSGFYIQALVKGLYPVPPSDPQKRASLETEAKEHGLLALFEELEIIDPAYAKKIGPKDRHRILRALEILRHGPFKTIDEINQLMRAQEKPFHFLQVGLRKTRDSFRNTLRERTFKMLKDGFIDEVEGLLAMGLKDWPPMKSVGYVDVIRYLELSVDNRNKEQLIEDIVTNSMGLAKRQMTWFRRSTGDELPMEWFDTDQEYEAACLRVTELVQGGNISK